MIPSQTIESFSEWVKSTLNAHSGDIEEEARSNEKGKAVAKFELTVQNIAGDKWIAKCKSRFPRAPASEDASFDFQLQLRLNGM